MIEHTYINPEHNDHSNTNKDVYGLGFKSGDNTVNLTVPEINLGLNDFTVEIWARTEGSNDWYQAILGNKSSQYIEGDIKISTIKASCGNNGVWSVLFNKQENSIYPYKQNSTQNLHHIVITRQGTLVTATINGRLIKSVTQDRVLDFSKFVFDIANTTYFSLGRVFNYAMSADEVQMLWNGGRVDEVILNNNLINFLNIQPDLTGNVWTNDVANTTSTTIENGFKVDASSSFNGDYIGFTTFSSATSFITNKSKVYAQFEMKVSSNLVGKKFYFRSNNGNEIRNPITPTTDWVRYTSNVEFNGTGSLVVIGSDDLKDVKGVAFSIEIRNVKIYQCNCLLELLPQNIHSSGIYNTGSLGSSHDAVLSKPAETIFIKERPYRDKQMSVGAPNFHPIAMGQECYNTVNGDIYRASIPPVEREWSVADWKKINII